MSQVPSPRCACHPPAGGSARGVERGGEGPAQRHLDCELPWRVVHSVLMCVRLRSTSARPPAAAHVLYGVVALQAPSPSWLACPHARSTDCRTFQSAHPPAAPRSSFPPDALALPGRRGLLHPRPQGQSVQHLARVHVSGPARLLLWQPGAIGGRCAACPPARPPAWFPACPPCLPWVPPCFKPRPPPPLPHLPCSYPEGGLTSGQGLFAALGGNCTRLDAQYTMAAGVEGAEAPSPDSAPTPAPTPASAALALARPTVLGALAAAVAGAMVLLG